MYFYQPICGKCGVTMQCEKNGVYATWSATHRRVGDMYACPKCGCKVLRANSEAIHDVSAVSEGRTLDMNE